MSNQIKALCICLIFTFAFAADNCLDLDGTNDYVSIADTNSLDFTNSSSYTIEAWIYPEGFNFLGGIVSKYQTVASNGYTLRLTQNYPYDGLSFDELITPTGILSTNTWYHIAAVNAGGIRKLYVNGIEQTLSGTPLSVAANTDPLKIGCDYSERYFNGKIDEVRIWNTARTQADIQTYMNIELSGDETGLTAYYQMSDGSGTSLTDNSANSHTGTFSGETAWTSSTALQGDVPLGSGTSASPYQIGTPANLYWVAQHSGEWTSGKYFLQTADIDASITSGWDGGAGFTPIGNTDNDFSGNYDGGNHSISSLFIDRNTSSYQALFGKTYEAVIENTALNNATITGGSPVGALIGYSNETIVNGCSSSGSVTGDTRVGGLIGDCHYTSAVNTSFSHADVTAGGNMTGGLIGLLATTSTISNCFSTGQVEGIDYVGGLVGDNYNQSQIQNSYSAGSVTADVSASYVGGLTGRNYSTSTISNSFWDTQTSNQSTNDEGTGKTTAEMKDVATFTNTSTAGLTTAWDFTDNPNNDEANDDIWAISASVNDGYPYLTNNTVSDDPLPISLISFSADILKGSVELLWETASETNNGRFIIYRDTQIIGSMEGSGTTSEHHSYSFTDSSIVPGSRYVYTLADMNFANEIDYHVDQAVTVVIPKNDIRRNYLLNNNYPNPFNPVTTISYQLFSKSDITLSVYDMNGKLISTLVNSEIPAGYHEVVWDASQICSGVYFYRIMSNGQIETRKMLLIK